MPKVSNEITQIDWKEGGDGWDRNGGMPRAETMACQEMTNEGGFR